MLRYRCEIVRSSGLRSHFPTRIVVDIVVPNAVIVTPNGKVEARTDGQSSAQEEWRKDELDVRETHVWWFRSVMRNRVRSCFLEDCKDVRDGDFNT